MKKLKIDTGSISLEVEDGNGNIRGVFTFNPGDISSAKKFYELLGEIETKQSEFETREEACQNDEERINLLSDLIDYLNESIDKCWGAGSSKILFGDDKTLTMYEDFMEGILPYYDKASKNRQSKYKKK